jgi:hypothetical protein
MSLIFRITSSGQDDEPVTDEDCSSDSENEEKKKEDDEESEDEVTRHSEVQVIFSLNIITVVLSFVISGFDYLRLVKLLIRYPLIIP